MPFISITRVRVRSWRYVPSFLHSAGALLQAKFSSGNLSASVLADAHFAFWSRTVWSEEAATRASVTFRRAPAIDAAAARTGATRQRSRIGLQTMRGRRRGRRRIGGCDTKAGVRRSGFRPMRSAASRSRRRVSTHFTSPWESTVLASAASKNSRVGVFLFNKQVTPTGRLRRPPSLSGEG